MKVLIILCSLLVAVSARNCYNETVTFCANKRTDMKHCGAKYGHVEHVNSDLQDYVQLHISSSFNYLLMMTNFGGYMRNREGMEKVFRNLSDRTWEDAIELIKYMNKRGVVVKLDTEDKYEAPGTFKINEIQSLARALDSQKLIAKQAIHIHRKATEKDGKYDPEVASFLENNFLHKHADIIRNLAGLTSDLHEFIGKTDISAVSVFIFDEYLKKMM